MLSETLVKKILDAGLNGGADFAEVFVEESNASSVDLTDKKIDNVQSANSYGVGVRLMFGDDAFYGYSSDDAENTLLELTQNLAKTKAGGAKGNLAAFQPQSIDDKHLVMQDPASVPKTERAELLRQLDDLTRSHGDAVKQVSASVAEKHRSVLVANSEGLWVEDARQYSRMRVSAIAESGSGPQVAAESPGVLGGYEFFKGLDLENLARSTAQGAIAMAGAGYIDGGMMPVVLGNGFGGVIFHEACGHPLETEAIRKNASPFAGKIGQQVAQPILTAIDDGTLVNSWGSLNVDDEGMPTQRTVLIENGILKGYLSDRLGARQVGVPRTGSARRESYKYAPVSRMRNTFIDKGNNTVDEMISSVDYGLYAKKMGGGSVDPATGEFNFSVQEGYIIRKGKIAEPVRGATLIGKGFEVLPLISMIGDDLDLAAGMCGASSGWVPTTVGQPTIKIDNILVGGR